MKVIGRELRLGDPETADVVIFDEVGSAFVRKALNPAYRVAVFKARPEELRIGVRIILNFLRFLARFRFGDAAGPRGTVRGILRQLRLIYLKACLAAMKPRAVVTFIDNSTDFHWLSRNCRGFPLVAIQNGGRLRYAAADTPGYYLQHLFCFGAHETRLFPDIGYHVENYHPAGSLVASLHFDPSLSADDHRYDLLVVSSWRGNIGWQQDVRDSMRAMEVMDRLLARYIESRQVKAAVILRAERDGEHWNVPGIGTEFDYFRGIYSDHIEIIETDSRVRNVYSLMQQSHLIVSWGSTALIEAYGIGKKILYCNFTGTGRYHEDHPECIVTNDSSWDSFSGRLDELFKEDQSEYQRKYEDSAHYLMSYPEGGSTYETIAKKIDQVIANFRLHS